MDAPKISANPCPIAHALASIGDTWSMMILRDAGFGSTRFEQFRAGLGIAPNILTRRLAALTADGLLEKRRYNERPPRDEYVLTRKGRDFLPIITAIGEWGRNHCDTRDLSYLVDVETGARIEAVVIDRASGRPLDQIDKRLVMPGD